MIERFCFKLGCAAVLCAAALSVSRPAHAQGVTRVKATLVALNGDFMTLKPLSAAPLMKSETPPASSDAPAGMLTVTLLDETRYVQSVPTGFESIKAGDYAGATVVEKSGGWLRAQAVYLYAPELRGTGEGRFPDQDRLIVNGTVTRVQPTAPQDTNDGTLTLHYRGALLSPAGPNSRDKGRTVCEGRAAPAAFASALACEGDATVEVLSGTPIAALTPGDRSMLVVGATLSVTIAKAGERSVAPGVIVEKPFTALKSTIVEKPQSAP